MNRTIPWIASALLFTATFSQARSIRAANEPRAALRQTEADALKAASDAEDLERARQNILTNETDMEFLMQIDDDIHRLGKDVAHLESEQASLTPWEREALMKAVPLLRDAASNADQAVLFLKGNVAPTWTSKAFQSNTEKIQAGFAQAAKLLRNYLKLEDTAGREEQLRQNLGLKSGS